MKSLVSIALLAFAACLPAGPAAATGTAGFMSNLPPLAREGATVIRDGARDRMLLVTGSDGNLGYPSVYARPLDGSGEWIDLRPGAGPGPRVYASIVLDTVHDQLVMFGGRAFSRHGPWYNDVWVLPLGGSGTWTQITPSGVPPIARSGAAAVFDPVTRKMFVFGGEDCADSDTWELSLAGAPAWTPLAAAAPPTRILSSAILDPVRRRMVVFGGQRTAGGSGYTNEVWWLSLDEPTAWTSLTTAGTPPIGRFGHVAIYEPVLDAMIVQGGEATGAIEAGVWKLTLAGTPMWGQILASGDGPGPRTRAGAIFDPVRSRMVVVGGAFVGASLQFFPLQSSIRALATSGGFAWTSLDSRELMNVTLDLCGHRSIWDPQRDRMVVLGGRLSGPRAMAIGFTGPSMWTEVGGSLARPSNRGGAAAAYDPVRDRIIMYSGGEGPVLYGFAGYVPYATDLWAFNMSATGDAWELLTGSIQRPSARTGGGMCYDPIRDRMLLFAGEDSLAGNNDLWELPMSGPQAMQWSELAPIGGPPSVRESFTMVYDPVHDRMIISGGRMTRRDTGTIDDVWLLSMGDPPTWTPVQTPMPSVGRNAAIYDPVRDRFLAMTEDPSNVALTASLTFDPTPTWNVETPEGDRTLALELATMVYDPARDRFLIYGGEFEHRLLFELAYGTPIVPRITPLDPGAWATGEISIASFTVTNPYAFAQSFDWKARDARQWLAVSASGTLTIPARDSAVLEVAIPVPDSAAPGVNVVSVRGMLRSTVQPLDASTSLHDVTTAALASLASASAEPGRVKLAWVVGAGSGARVVVERRDPESAWAAKQPLDADGSGWVRYEDADVTAGGRYGYRLSFPGSPGVTAGEVWIDVPARLDFALVGARPNPNDRELTLSFRLPTAAPARLELVDLAGRVVRSVALAHPEPGAQFVALDPRRALPAGLYFARLSQGTRQQIRKVTVVR